MQGPKDDIGVGSILGSGLTYQSYNCALHVWAVHHLATTYASVVFLQGT